MARKTAPIRENPIEKKSARANAPAAKHKTSTPRMARAAAASVAQASACSDPPFEEIERQAYFYWVDRGFSPGDPTADWLRAEEEVRQRYLRNTASTRP